MIEVRIPYDEFIEIHPAHVECYIISELKAAGIPVKGCLTFQGLELGTLQTYIDPINNMKVFNWSENNY